MGGIALLEAQQAGDVVVIPSAEEQVAADVATCGHLAGMERSVCLANIALDHGDIAPCTRDFSGECGRLAASAEMNGCDVSSADESQRAACKFAAVNKFPVVEACDQAKELGGTCWAVVASHSHSAAPILERMKPGEERDQALSFYVTTTGDMAALEQVQDSFIADGARILGSVAQAARTETHLDEGMCWGLRGGYDQERWEGTDDAMNQSLCLHAVHLINEVTDRLKATESEDEKKDIARQLLRLAEAAERQGQKPGRFDEDDLGPTLEELAGAEPEPESITKGRAARSMADTALDQCDFVAAASYAAELHDLDPHHPWLIAHGDDVARRAPIQRAFRAAMGGAQAAFDAALEAGDPGALAVAAVHAQSAAELAGQLCQAAVNEAETLQAQLAMYAEALAEQQQGEGKGEGFIDDRPQTGGTSNGGAGSTDWPEPVREEVADDPCRGPRPEYDAALHEVEVAIQLQDLARLTKAVSSGLVPRCPGDADRLFALRGQAIALETAMAQIAAQGMDASLGRAREREADRDAAWASALGTIQGILGELERARAATRPSPTEPIEGSWLAGTTSPGEGSTPSSEGTCMVERAVDSSAGTQRYWVVSSSTMLCGRSLAIYGIRGTSGSAGVGGAIASYASLAEAQAHIDRLCPPANRSTGQVRCR